ncbi:MAG: hypothetical protein WBF42_16615 [Terracidiphilus sp.]
MRIPILGFLVAACCSAICCAQAHENYAPAEAKNPAPVMAPPPAPAIPPPPPFASSAILGSSLDTVKQTLDAVRVDKWKRGTVRDEATDDINSIQREIQENLPPLMQQADAAQGALSKVLPVAAHVDALYDVLLRVLEAARISAPDEQASAIRQALNGLSSARLSLDKHILERATAQEKQVNDLHAVMEKQAAFKCPAPPPTPVCSKPPVKKPRKKTTTAPNANPPGPETKPAAKPAAIVAPPKQ